MCFDFFDDDWLDGDWGVKEISLLFTWAEEIEDRRHSQMMDDSECDEEDF